MNWNFIIAFYHILISDDEIVSTASRRRKILKSRVINFYRLIDGISHKHLKEIAEQLQLRGRIIENQNVQSSQRIRSQCRAKYATY